MKDSEQRAYVWLLSQGYTDIKFHSSSSPDFITNTGEKFEVKKVRNNVIWFGPSQLKQLATMRDVKIIVMDGGENPVAVFPFSEIKNGFWNSIKIAGGNYDEMRSIRVSDDLWWKAKRDALDHGMTLQDWLTLLIMQGKQEKVVHNPVTGNDYPVRPRSIQ